MTQRRVLIAALGTLSFGAAADGPSDTSRASGRPKRVLLVGLDPAVVDYAQIPGLDARKLNLALARQQADLQALGHDARWCFIDAGLTAERKVVDVLRGATFEVVSVGAGVRQPPENLLLFERVVNAIHQHAPGAKICFSRNADDTVQAVQRWL